MIPVNPDDRFAILTFNDGKIQKQELNQGSSFLSQSASFMNISDLVSSVSITDDKGRVRNISIGNGIEK